MTSHPVQYQAPLLRLLAGHDRIDLSVFYGHDGSLVGELDREFGRSVAWDRPLLGSYASTFLTRRAERRGTAGRLAGEVAIIGHLWRGRFDAVLIHSYATRLSLFAYLGAVLSGTAVFLRTESERMRRRHRATAALKHILLRPLFAVTAAFLVIGRANREFFDHYGVPTSRQFLTPYSVDNGYFTDQRRTVAPRRHDLRRSHGWPDDTVVVGYAGKLIPRKRVADLVDALAILRSEGLPVGLLVVGDGADRTALQERARSRCLDSAVFVGFKNQSELAPFYACMDVFVLPSDLEPWGLVLNEAMLFGLPVIASSRVGAALDLIEPDRNGYVYPAGDVSSLTECLRHLVTSRDARERFGARSEAIVQAYSYEQCVRGILEALDRVIGTPGRAAPALARGSS